MTSHPRRSDDDGAGTPPARPARAPRHAHVTIPLATIGALSMLAALPQSPPPGAPGRPTTATSATTATGIVGTTAAGPTPMVGQQAVQWWAAFKFNAATYPTDAADPARHCAFGGSPTPYAKFGQRYAVATSRDPALRLGDGLIGTGPDDPVGATFGNIYRGRYHYVVWNDQFYDAPKIDHCTKECGSPWGHSKGVLAWDDSGQGTILQVTTPSWPAAGGANDPRAGDGNTLGCTADNNVLVSQDFFALKLSKDDVVDVLKALANSSVVTDPSDAQIVSNGGPADIQALVASLGAVSGSATVLKATLSSGVRLISKPSSLHVPPWQMVSAELGGIPLRVASWWAKPQIPDSDGSTAIGCWDQSLPASGAVTIAHAGQWMGKRIGLDGGPGADFNHAKIGYSTDGVHNLAIFGDMNQQGALSGTCASSQNGRGGMFFVVESRDLVGGLSALLGDPGRKR